MSLSKADNLAMCIKDEFDDYCNEVPHLLRLYDWVDQLRDLAEPSTHWNTAAHLPTPGIKLHCRLHDGRIVAGVRPSYISDRKNDDLGYRSLDGEVLNVKEWSIQ